METYVLMLAKNFLATHPRKGQETGFATKVQNAINTVNKRPYATQNNQSALKFHTCRENYEYWQQRFEKIYKGEACLSVRQWSGRPRQSKAVEIFRFTKDNLIGLQRLDFVFDKTGKAFTTMVDRKVIPVDKIAHNDGLSLQDWTEWFKGADLTKPMALIQLTQFRY